MFINIFHSNRRRDIRIDLNFKICAAELLKYDQKNDEIIVGDCTEVELLNIGPSGLCVRHNNVLKKGSVIEFRSKCSINDKDCLSCRHFSEITDDLPMRAFFGKVIWCSASLAGLNINMIHAKDLIYLRKICKTNKKIVNK